MSTSKDSKWSCSQHDRYDMLCDTCIAVRVDLIPKKGKRFDAGKPRVDLFPGDALLYLGKIYAYGARKYDERNWEKGMKWTRMIGPLLRHTLAFMIGKKYDNCGKNCEFKDADFCKDHSRLLHSGHIAWNGLGLLTYELRGIGEDDRGKVGND